MTVCVYWGVGQTSKDLSGNGPLQNTTLPLMPNCVFVDILCALASKESARIWDSSSTAVLGCATLCSAVGASVRGPGWLQCTRQEGSPVVHAGQPDPQHNR
jgi:hypothetical protein